MEFINKVANPLGGIKIYGIVCIVIFVLYMIGGGISAARRSAANKAAAQSITQSEQG